MDADEPLALISVVEPRERYIYDNYNYVVDRKRKDGTNTIYLVCKFAKRARCKGRGISTNGVFRKTQDHNHAGDPETHTIAQFKKELRLSCQRQFRNQKEIYDELRILYPEAAVTVTYASVESSMRRWRKSVHPRIPSTLEEYGVILRLPRWKHVLGYKNDTRHMLCDTVTATDGSVSVIFGNPEFIQTFSATREIFVDATFKVVPAINGAYQLLTVMATAHDHALPFAWALMSRKTRPAYDSVFGHLKNTLAPTIRPTAFMTDFERALQSSLNALYEDAVPHGCFFHYCQALYRKARSLHIPEEIVADEGGQKLLRKIMALALLPAHEIEVAFGVLAMNATNEQARIFEPLFTYYEQQWLRRVTARLFSVYGLIRRTNNSIKSYHRVLLDKMAPHPNIWDFTKKLVSIQFAAEIDFLALGRGNAVSRPAKIGYVLSHRQITRAWEKLRERRITVTEFVEEASYFVSKLARNLGFADQEINNEEHDRELIEAGVNPDDPLAEVPQNMPFPAVEAPIVGPIEARPVSPENHPAPYVPVDVDENDFPAVNFLEDNGGNPEGERAGEVISDDDSTDDGEDFRPVPRGVQQPNLAVVEEQQQTNCLTCPDGQSCYICLPCFHMVLCGACANGMLRVAHEYDRGRNPQFGRVNCPLCRGPVQEFRRVFMPIA